MRCRDYDTIIKFFLASLNKLLNNSIFIITLNKVLTFIILQILFKYAARINFLAASWGCLHHPDKCQDPITKRSNIIKIDFSHILCGIIKKIK